MGADDVGIANSEARAHYKKALEYADRGLWSPEILELSRAHELEPRNPTILVELGTAYGERKDWTTAVAMLRKAVAIAPTSVQAHYSLALTLDRANPGKGSGIPEYRAALRLNPQHVDSLMNLGVDIADRNAAEAKPLFQRALRLAPANANVHLNYALLLKRRGDESASVSEFEQAIRYDPNLLEARRQLISILVSQQKWSQVIEQCREILTREPENAAIRYTLAQALIHHDHADEGKRELELAMTLRKRTQEKRDAESLQKDGIRALRSGEMNAAMKSFRSALDLEPSASNHMYLGVALSGAGETDAGIRELKTALQLEPASALAHVNLGSVYLQTGQESPAKEEFSKALEIDPWLAEAHNNLGMILAKNDQYEDAAKHFELAADLEPHYLEAVFNLGLALRNLNRINDALKAFRRAADLAPDNPQAQYALGMTLRDKGDAAAARVALDRAAALSGERQLPQPK